MKFTRRILTPIKECEICKNLIEKPYKETMDRWGKTRFCSRKCSTVWMVQSGALSRAGKKAGEVYWSTQEARDAARERMMGEQRALGYKHTDKAKKAMSLKRTSEKHPMWKSDKASYSAFHKWLINNYGPANKCENLSCPQLPSIRFEYALIFDNHTHSRLAYKMLCIPCHRSFDSRLNKLNVNL